MPSKIAPENYVFKFGKFRDMKATDILKLSKVDKDGNDVAVGKKYLEWVCTQEWFKHADIIKHVIAKYNDCITDEHESEPEVPKLEPKKKKEKSKEPKTVKIDRDEESKTLNFQ